MIEGLLASAGRLESVLSFGAGLAAVIVFLKLLRRNEFEVWGVKIRLGYAWIVFAILTIAHLYTGIRFIQRCYAIAFDASVSDLEAWQTLTNGTLLWFDGLIARVQHIEGPGGISLYIMDAGDLTTWLAHAGAVAMFFSIVRIFGARWRVRIATIVVAVVISVSNWTIGSNWIIAASELTVAPENRNYLNRLNDQFGENNGG